MTDAGTSGGRPGEDEIEVVLFGPGYGESIVIHIGDGSWIIVDSCINTEGKPRALEYLDSIGVNAGQEVDLVVATHWHDDHIRGMATLVEVCTNAHFCCANTLLNEEFLAAIDALESRHLTVEGSGVREIYHVLNWLRSRSSRPKFASANRRIHSHGKCEIWSLSPSDAAFQSFLNSVGALLPREGQSKTRIPSISPNEFSVVLWIAIDDVAVLLGSDLEKYGWKEILNSDERPTGKASVLKVPHHGSKGADESNVWRRMLIGDPYAVIIPWRKGSGALPSQDDIQRILSYTKNAFATAKPGGTAHSPKYANRAVARTIRSTGIKLRELDMSPGAIRLRRPINSSKRWQVETFGTACHLEDFAVK